MQPEILDAYCGPAPVPADLWSSWNFDPLLLGSLALGVMLWRHGGRVDRTGTRSLAGAAALIVVAFVSPLCALSSALFSARVAHHLLLIGAIAPLLAVALPWRSGPRLPLSALVIVHAFVVWLWHAPAPYAFALSTPAAYWLMEGTLFLSAWLLWRGVFASRGNRGGAVLALLATIMQMGFLGAFLVFAPQPLFTAHLTTTPAFGLTPLADQQLSGLLMWVPAFIPYAGVALHQILAILGTCAAEGGPRSSPAARS